MARKASGFESDEDVRPESDSESIASGFTEKPVATKSVAEKLTVTDDVVEEPDEAQKVVEKATEADNDNVAEELIVVEEPNEADNVTEALTETNKAAEEEVLRRFCDLS